ncbi:hypothetical protein FRC03_005106 [Tulasnella sp. 419]|nr:hypothetical protein FRC03_005106 [Tulasnella sp. 419]
MSAPNPKEKPPKPKSKAKGAPQSDVKLKAIIRRLPPHLPESKFWDSVSPWVTDETCSWKVFHQGKPKKRDNQEVVPSRAYVAFRTAEQLVSFSRAYDGHMFRDKQGNESFAVVEFAPFQKIPSEKKKQDTRAGTIEEDADYQSFLASLEAPAEPVAVPEVTKPTQDEPTTTPLLASLIAEKTANKDRESILRYHGHYRGLDALPKKRDMEDDREFSRDLSKVNDPEPFESRAGKGGSSSNAPPGESQAPSKKQRHQKPNPNAPASPSRAQKAKGAAEKSASSTSTSAPAAAPGQKKRPIFKFDAALAGVRPKGAEAPTPTARIDDEPAANSTEPSGGTTEQGGGPSKRLRLKQKKELKKLEHANAAAADSAGSGPSTPRPGAAKPPPSGASEQKTNTATRPDDTVDSGAPPKPATAGIIAIPPGG